MSADDSRAKDEDALRVLACLDQTPHALIVARRAGRLAHQLRAPWEAVHVATPLGQRASLAKREVLLEAFRLAEQSGAETHTLNGADPAAEILDYARGRKVSHIVVGAPLRPPWLFADSFAWRLLRGAGDIAIDLAPCAEKDLGAQMAGVLRPPPLGDPGAYFVALALVALATLIAVPLDRALGLPNISLVYVLAVIAAAVRYGAAPAAFTAVASALAYNFFLLLPLYTFTIADPVDIWALFFFLAVGVAVSGVAAHARAQTVIARRQARDSADLQAFAHDLVAAREPTEIAVVVATTASRLLYARVVVQIEKHRELETIAEAPGPEMLGGDDMAAAQSAFEHRREAGHGSSAHASARWLFIPIPSETGAVGVIGVRPIDDASRLDPEQRRILDVIAVQAGVALDRTRLAHAAADARVETESERLKANLLPSLSHDLRTPLATIRASLESLLRNEDRPDATWRDVLVGAVDEAKRLSGFVQNRLDTMRIDVGGVRARPAPADIADIVDGAVDRAHRELEGKFVSRDLATELTSVTLDRALTEAALANILETAGRNSPTHGKILIRARREGGSVAIEILDEGEGFPEALLPILFDQSARGVEGDRGAPGLGLAIAKGFVTAQGGAIEASNRADRSGAQIRIVLPIDKN